jgi:predicted ATPase/DNA-binding SARP family transcriptional activator
MARLVLTLLGPLQVTRNGQLLRGLTYDKVRALLAYLAVEADRPQRRDVLAGLLWPDQPDRKARHSLRQALATLRQAIGDQTADPPFLLISYETVQFNPASDYELDVATFTALLAACDTHAHRQIEACPACAQRLAQAVTLHRGGFLEQFFLRDSAPFEEWALLTRERLHQQALQVLTDLASYHEQRGEYAPMQRYAQRQIELEPWNEAAHRQVMRALVQSGERGAALAQYARCRHILADELGVEPEEATTALYQRIRDGTEAQGMQRAEETRATPMYNLPAPPTPLIGRHDELAALAALLRDPACRLVTIVGPPGIGKTRLSQEIVVRLRDEFEDGVVFVALAPIHDPNLVATAIAQPLGVKEHTNRPLLQSLKDELHDKRILVVVDNFEQVVDAVPLVSELLAAAPDLTVLVTSRVPLHLAGEQEYALPPLALPPRPSQLSAPSSTMGKGAQAGIAGRSRALSPVWETGSGGERDVTQYDAIRLFHTRAQAVNHAFAVTAANAPIVTEICYRLDGLPLAIELAAARVKLFTPQALLARLDHRLNILTGGARDLPLRQQTLRGAIDWSYHLLGAEEQALFRRLGVFVGGWTLEAAEAICGDWNAESLISNLQSQILDGLASLVDQSLIKQEAGPDGEPRFTMLETIREYAVEWLEASGEPEPLRRRHAEYYLTLAETAELQLYGAEQVTWLDRLEAAHDNLRAALAWSQTPADGVEIGARLASALMVFWAFRGHDSEACAWLEGALALSSMLPAAVQARLLAETAQSVRATGSRERAQALGIQSLALYRELGDTRGIAKVLRFLGWLACDQGDQANMQARFEESLALYRELGDPWGLASSLQGLATCQSYQRNYARARTLLEESLALCQKSGNRYGIAQALQVLGNVLRMQGDDAQAAAHLVKSTALFRELGHRAAAASSLNTLGYVAEHQRDWPAMAAHFTENLALGNELGDKQIIAESLIGLAGALAAQGQPQGAARLFGAAEALYDIIGQIMDPVYRTDYDRNVTAARTQLGEAAWEAAYAEGRAMSLEQAIAEALRVADRVAEA